MSVNDITRTQNISHEYTLANPAAHGRRGETRTSIDDLILDHLVSRSGRPVFVNPIRLIPMVVWDQTKVDISIRQDPHPSTSHTDRVSE